MMLMFFSSPALTASAMAAKSAGAHRHPGLNNRRAALQPRYCFFWVSVCHTSAAASVIVSKTRPPLGRRLMHSLDQLCGTSSTAIGFWDTSLYYRLYHNPAVNFTYSLSMPPQPLTAYRLLRLPSESSPACLQQARSPAGPLPRQARQPLAPEWKCRLSSYGEI